MISVCTVVDDLQSRYFDLFAKSLLATSKLVTDIIVAKITNFDTNNSYEEKVGNVTFKHLDVYIPQRCHWISYKHSIGMHKCLEKVTTKYVILSDCDLFFLCPAFDEFYVQTLEQNDLNIIGIEMYKSSAWHDYQCSYGSFPSIHNCLVRLDTLPPPEMFKDKLHYHTNLLVGCPGGGEKIEENYFLVAGCIPEYSSFYPHPNGHYDTGCKLLAWNELRKGKWLTFSPGWRYVPVDKWFSNVDNIVMPVCQGKHLLYHQAGLFEKNDFPNFALEFEKHFDLHGRLLSL